jgi:hypothetical protein
VLSAGSDEKLDADSVAESMADCTDPCSPSADSTADFSAEASSLLKRLKTEGVNADWAFDRSTKGVEVVMEREEKAACEEAARKAARRMRCLDFFVSLKFN